MSQSPKMAMREKVKNTVQRSENAKQPNRESILEKSEWTSKQ